MGKISTIQKKHEFSSGPNESFKCLKQPFCCVKLKIGGGVAVRCLLGGLCQEKKSSHNILKRHYFRVFLGHSRVTWDTFETFFRTGMPRAAPRSFAPMLVTHPLPPALPAIPETISKVSCTLRENDPKVASIY